MDMRFGTWNVQTLYGSGSSKTVSGELAKYKLDLVGVQEVRWDKGGTEPAGDLFPSMQMANGNADYHLGTGVFVHNRIISAV
jgi:exonuclease III